MSIAKACEGRSDAMGFAGFAGQKYLNLETFKKNGTGVRTPVWFAADRSINLDSNDAKLYVYTICVSLFRKRRRNRRTARHRPCGVRANVLGQWTAARTQSETGPGANGAMPQPSKRNV